MKNASSRANVSSRREFLKVSAAATVTGALAGQVVAPPAVFAAENNTLRIGLVGCGGRGSGAASQALSADKNVVLTAVGDAFKDRLDSSLANLKKKYPDKVKVDPERCFVGFDAYKQVIDSGVDVVILTSPPGFRPVHLKYAVDAGKHIFCEKPMATDAPGVRSVIETVKKAKEKNLALVAGCCWRYSYPERAIFDQIHQDGAIGDVMTCLGTYQIGDLWSRPRKPEWSDMEWQVRNWLYFTWLSGDHIVEQAVHTIDKIGWAMKDAAPVKAMAQGGRQTRVDPAYGHIFDHFSVVYEFANGARGILYCRQQAGCDNDVSDWILGTKGIANVLNSRSIKVNGQTTWKYTGKNNDMYQTEHDELFASIRAGKPINDGDRMMNSTMMAILGRMAAYTGKTITWEQAMKSKESLVPEKLEWGSIATPPVAMPGKTPLI